MKYLAQITDYKILAPLPDVRTGVKQGGLNDLPGYLPNMFNLIIGLAAVLAVGWIVWGGIEYMTSDSWMGKDDGKKRIKNAIIGLIIVIMSWLILYTINPKLLTLDLNINSTPITSTPVTTGTGGGCQNCLAITSFAIKGGAGNFATPGINSILTNLSQSLSFDQNMWVTDAYTLEGPHIEGGCHSTGSCVDINFQPTYTKTNNNIKEVILATNQIPGASIHYEVPDSVPGSSVSQQAQQRINELVNSGVPRENIWASDNASGEHFRINTQ